MNRTCALRRAASSALRDEEMVHHTLPPLTSDTSRGSADVHPLKRLTVMHMFTYGSACQFIGGFPAFMRPFGVDVCIATTRSHHAGTFEARENVRIYDVRMKRTIAPFHDVIATVRLWALLRKLRPELVHTHTPKASLLGGLAGWLARVPVVHSVHGLVHLGRKGLSAVLIRESERVACGLARSVICVSPSIRDVLVAEGLCSPEKAVTSFVGIDAESR